MEDLLRDLSACRMPHSCPHGRPTVVRFSLNDINKMFKRT
jgi:DNA mismatch repair protein MutL